MSEPDAQLSQQSQTSRPEPLRLSFDWVTRIDWIMKDGQWRSAEAMLTAARESIFGYGNDLDYGINPTEADAEEWIKRATAAGKICCRRRGKYNYWRLSKGDTKAVEKTL